ncbi:hypothetical protein [Morganella morganii]|uniref:tail fiber/spike domain-containing protein n=1 Tax=Morganella morganii TaxID=582 RepID=UPI0016488C77|nr:hypothetical protein [Morganella morganii]MBC4002239.1 hypothetical protein [Morganella morganii]
MTTIPTQNAVPSEAPRDLKFNSGKIDEFVTSLEHEYKDRFGRSHMTIEGMKWMFDQLVERFKVDINQAIIAAGYIPMDSFQLGAEITKRNEILRDETTGEYYRWDGDLPKSVPAGATPESSGGVGVGKWVSVGDASLRMELSKPKGTGLIGAKYKNTDTLFTLTDYIQNEVYADLFIREGERVIDGIHAACDYVESNGGGVVHLSARTYLIEDELILRDKVAIRGRGCGQWSGVTTIKWAGGNGDGKAVVRASRYPLGQEGTNAVASSGITDVFINADGCDVGLYSYYAVNRTIFDRVVSRYATKANIYINKSWFATFGNLVGLTGKDKGIVIGYPLFGETGEMNINSCTFGNLSANQNGQDTDLTKESNGVGILLGRRMAACSFSSIQAETNRGIGLVIESSYTNTINSIYLEDNAEGNSTYPSLSMFYKNSGNFGAMNIGSLYLAPRQVVRNDVDLGMVIAGMYRNDNINTFIGDGRCIITSTNLLSHGNTDWSKIASDIEILADFKSVNIQLTSEVIKNTFVTYSRTGYTFMTITPKNNYSLSSAVVLGVDTGTTSFGTSFTKDTPVTKRIGSVTNGHHKIFPGGVQPSSETLFDIQVLVVRSRCGGLVLPTLTQRDTPN